jgi:hypothetical protein
MVVVESPNQYKFLRFEVSGSKSKKYDAILQHKATGRYKRVPFGDSRFEQYRDKTGLGVYSSFDHRDKKRRELYYSRHGKEAPKFSSKWFSHHFLW